MNLSMWIGGIVIGAVVSFAAGYWVRQRRAAAMLGSAEVKAQQVMADAAREAE